MQNLAVLCSMMRKDNVQPNQTTPNCIIAPNSLPPWSPCTRAILASRPASMTYDTDAAAASSCCSLMLSERTVSTLSHSLPSRFISAMTSFRCSTSGCAWGSSTLNRIWEGGGQKVMRVDIGYPG